LTTDIWALGLMMFKAATGKAAFKGVTLEEVKPKVLACNYEWPENVEVDSDLKDLIQKILVPDPKERFGCPGTDHDIEAMKKHPFFKGINWNQSLN
jgi:serine/threonine protein kinase